MSDDKRESYLAVDRTAEKIAFLKRWGKDIPASLLKPGMNKRGEMIDPLAKPLPPKWEGSSQTRILVCREAESGQKKPRASLIDVDDDGRCAVQAHITPGWHIYHAYGPYAEARPVRVAARCPESLTPSEWGRVMQRDDAIRWLKDHPTIEVEAKVAESHGQDW